MRVPSKLGGGGGVTAFQKIELLHVTKAEILQPGVGMAWSGSFF